MSASTLVVLGVLGLVGGVGIAALGPGGVLPTVGLFVLTDLSPTQVAGTAIVTHVATGVLATAAFHRSGQLRERETRRTAGLLGGAAVVGTPVGVLCNTLVSSRTFGVVLGVLVAVVGALVYVRGRGHPRASGHPPAGPIAAIGLGVAAVSGLVGIGGPMLAVPLLVALGVPVLESLACAQVQSIVIAGVGSAGYLAAGAVDWSLALVVGVPELAGVLLGWRIAQALPDRTLRLALVAVLFGLAPYLALHG